VSRLGHRSTDAALEIRLPLPHDHDRGLRFLPVGATLMYDVITSSKSFKRASIFPDLLRECI